MIRPSVHLSFSYKCLAAYTRLAATIYFKRIEFEGLDQTIKNGPTIYALNHQNSFMDPVVFAAFIKVGPFFLTRADIFTKDHIIKALSFLRMIPVYRQRDGIENLSNNDSTFEFCLERLDSKDTIGIFPEGNHNARRKLRPLKKGLSRLAFLFEERNKFDSGLRIIPVGLNYENHFAPHGNFFIKVGTPLSLDEYASAFAASPQRAMIQFNQALVKGMEAVIVHIQDERYDLINTLREMYAKELARQIGGKGARLSRRFIAEKKIVMHAEVYCRENVSEADRAEKMISQYDALLADNGLKAFSNEIMTYTSANFLLDGLGWILLLAPGCIGWMLHLIPGLLINRMVRKFKDPHFHSPVRMVSAQILLPVYYAICAVMVGITGGSLGAGLIGFVALPTLGYVSIKWSEQCRKVALGFRVLTVRIWRKKIWQSIAETRTAIDKFMAPILDKALAN